jgi:hypothetical protein
MGISEIIFVLSWPLLGILTLMHDSQKSNYELKIFDPTVLFAVIFGWVYFIIYLGISLSHILDKLNFSRFNITLVKKRNLNTFNTKSK